MLKMVAAINGEYVASLKKIEEAEKFKTSANDVLLSISKDLMNLAYIRADVIEATKECFLLPIIYQLNKITSFRYLLTRQLLMFDLIPFLLRYFCRSI